MMLESKAMKANVRWLPDLVAILFATNLIAFAGGGNLGFVTVVLPLFFLFVAVILLQKEPLLTHLRRHWLSVGFCFLFLFGTQVILPLFEVRQFFTFVPMLFAMVLAGSAISSWIRRLMPPR
jgi:hypothetical protein